MTLEANIVMLSSNQAYKTVINIEKYKFNNTEQCFSQKGKENQ